jgi:hypothetical protein
MEPWIWVLEIFAAVMLLYSLGSTTLQALVRHGFAIPFVGGAIGLGVAVPALLRWQSGRWKNVTAIVAAVSVLTGGFLLRYSVLTAPRAIRSDAAMSDGRHALRDEWRSWSGIVFPRPSLALWDVPPRNLPHVLPPIALPPSSCKFSGPNRHVAND